MSETTGREAPGARVPLYERILALHLEEPDGPLPRPMRRALERRHPRHPEPEAPEAGHRRTGADVAVLLDEHFARPGARPGDLLHALHTRYLPIHPDEHIRAAAERADPELVRATARWLVRRGGDHCALAVGLALLAVAGTEDDTSLIRTCGLLSSWYGALAAHALERLPGSAEHLLWLAERVEEWGHVYVVEALCGLGEDPVVRPWLLRRACRGDVLDGYIVGPVARAARIHEVITRPDADAEVVEHTGQLLQTMTECAGMGMTLSHYPHAETVLAAHLRHLERARPGARAFTTVAWLVRGLAGALDAEAVRPVERWRPYAQGYAALLDRADWCEAARQARIAQDPEITWLLEREWGRRLRAFASL
ncbi:hypothetical protein [Streptomyces indicus]|uniref:Uncharacterized protein n=1 Tax=Streptomyces indicus TaxID=417292 RepID=A0A1G9B022_9ACTN|nr:hypothetical protein [Streptomyces indicus]SDK32872.1 hypothetical protein SAMN05421806_106249 [Streptomyces indicus]